MDKINLDENIDFSKVNIAGNKRDIQLWKRQATAKYCKQMYKEICQENEVLDREIENLERNIWKNGVKKQDVKTYSEKVGDSIIIASNTIDHLIQLKLRVKSEIASLKKEYGTLIDNYSNMYKEQRMALEKNNSVYRNLSEITTKVDKMKIQKNQSYQNKIDKTKILKQKCVIKSKILITNIVEFAKGITRARKLESINNKLAEIQAEAQNLVRLYEKQTDLKRNTQKYGYIQKNELPKLSIQMKPMYKPVELNMPQLTSTSKTLRNTLKVVPVPKINEMSLLQKLKERSTERLKIMCQGQHSCIPPIAAREQETKHVENNSSTTRAIDENEIENKLDILQQHSPKPPSKLNVLQNELICNNNTIESRATEIQKRDSREIVKGIIKRNKNKIVSFGEYISQDDPTANIFATSENTANTTAKSSQDMREMSSYVSTKSNVENYQEEAPSSVVSVIENPTSPQLRFHGEESFSMTKDSNEAYERYTFSPTEIAENVFEQTAKNTFFSWNQPNSQQNVSFGNVFNMF